MSQGFQGALGIDSVTPVGVGFEFESCQITKSGQIVDTSGIRGSRERLSARTRAGNYTIAGTIELYPSPEDLALLLPWSLGAAGESGTFNLSDTLASRYVVVDKVAQVLTYAGCYVGKATFSGSEGQAVKLALAITGQTETIGAAGSFPSVTYSGTPPFMFAESVLTILSTARQVKQWTLAIDNQLEAPFYNSQSASAVLTKDRQITFECQNPFTTDEIDLYNQDPAGAAASLALAFAGHSLTFSFGALQFPPQGPVVPGRDQILLPLSGTARKNGGTPSLSVALSS